MKNDLLYTQISEGIQNYGSESINEKVGFLVQYVDEFESSFGNLIQDRPKNINGAWSALSDILSQTHQRLNDSSELETLLPPESQVEKWREPYHPILTKSDTKISLPIDDSFWRLKASKSTADKLKKIIYYAVHPIDFIRSYGYFNTPGKKPERTLSPNLFNEVFVLQPILEYQWQELHQLLLFHSKELIRMQSASKKLKDNILQTVELDIPNTYWDSLNNLSYDKYLDQFKTGIGQIRDSIKQYKEDAESRLSLFRESHANSYRLYWRMAGTTLLPRRRFAERKAANLRFVAEKRMKLFREGWIKHLESVKDEWQKDLELGTLQLNIAILRGETGQIINQKSETKILPVLNQLHTRLEKARHEIDGFKQISKDELHEKLLQFNRNLLRGIREKELTGAVETLTNAHISNTFRGFITRVSDLVENLTESHVIIKDYNTDRFPPNTTIDEVMIKEIAQEEIVLLSERSNEEQITQLTASLDSITRTVSSLDQVIEFNFNAAIDLIRQDAADPDPEMALQTVSEGIDRALGLLNDAKNRYQQQVAEGLQRIDILAVEWEKGVQDLGDNERILELKLRLARARTRENLRKWWNDTWQIIITFLPKAVKIARNYISRLSIGYRKVRKISGLSPEAGKDRVDLSRYLRHEEQKITQLPFIYQRLFQILPLEEERFFLGRISEMNTIKEQFEAFNSGQITLTAIIGEKGNGKTTLLNFANKSIFKGYPIIRLATGHTIWTLPEFWHLLQTGLQIETNDVPDNIEQALLTGPKRIFILEDVHNLFLRTIDGFSVMGALMQLIAATQEKVFWILTSGIYGWNFLEYMVHISDFFTDVIELSNLDSGELEQLIMSRHNMSGFRLEFAAPDDIVGTRAYKKLKTDDERQDFLRQRFFEHLREVSFGNIKTALLYWVGSVTYSKPDEPMQVLDNIDLDQSFIYQIGADDLYYLAAYIQHEFLTVEEFALIFGIEPSQGKYIIDRMLRRGYLKRAGANYFISALLYRPIVYILKLKNIIY